MSSSEPVELSEKKVAAIKEATKKIYHLAKQGYSGKIILDSENGIITACEYKVREKI